MFGFAGQQQDPTGLQHLRARQYAPGLGRFTAYDPVQPGAPGTPGYSLYGYAGSNPTTWTDPTGRSLVEYSFKASDSADETTVVAGAQELVALEALYAAPAYVPPTVGAVAGGSSFAVKGLGVIFVLAGLLFGQAVYSSSSADEPVVLPTITEPATPGDESGSEAEPQPATDGAGSKDGDGSSCDAISVGDAMQQISDFLGGDGRVTVSGSGNYQWITTEQVAGDTITRVGRLDINPNSPHVVKFGPHVNLETQINGKTVRTGDLADPHTAVDPTTIRTGDFPEC